MASFSVIIPTYNRPDALRRCLEGFTTLLYADWELIVVNDGGATSFRDIPLVLRQALPLRLIEQSNAGPASARNAGAKLAIGDYLAFTDDDCRVEPDWLDDFSQAFAQSSCVALGGMLLNPYPENTAASTWHRYQQFLYRHFVDTKGNHLLLPSNNVAYRRDVFDVLGGFDEGFPLAAAEDLDLGYRLVMAGHQQQHIELAKVWHFHRTTAYGYLKQQFRYGRGAYYLHQRHYTLQRPPRRRGAFYGQLVRYMTQEPTPLGMWCLLGLTSPIHALGRHYERLKNVGNQKREPA